MTASKLSLETTPVNATKPSPLTEYQYRPDRFYLITFLITWVSWLIAAYVSNQPGSESNFVTFIVPGMMAPTFAALWMILSSKNQALKQNFIRKLFDLRLIRSAGLLPVVLLMPAVVVVSILISTLFGQPISQLQLTDAFPLSGLVILVLTATSEELGWRGYAMDSLHSKRSYFSATIIFAVLWVLWHLPLFLINGMYQYELLHENPYFALNFIISLVPMAIIICWLYRVNRGSIGLIILFHLIMNLWQEVLQMGQVAKCIETVLLVVVAAVIVLLNKPLFFDRGDGVA